MAKYLVTGGVGFIGHHVVAFLIERGDTVIVIDNQAGGYVTNRYIDGANYLQYTLGELRHQKLIEEACAGVEYVIHLAALPRVQASIDDPFGTAQANVMGTVAILTAAYKAGVKRVVFASSSSVYGDSNKLPLHEGMTPSPMSPYARHKFLGEQFCQDYALAPFNLSTVCLRFFNVYGPGADPNGAYALVVAKFLEQKRKEEKLTITGDGKQTRDFTHVSDVVRAILLAAESDNVGLGEVINIGGGKQISVNEVAERIGGETEYIPARLEPHDTLADISKAERWLGWKPDISFADGMHDLVTRNS